jgi:hypothetical protein
MLRLKSWLRRPQMMGREGRKGKRSERGERRREHRERKGDCELSRNLLRRRRRKRCQRTSKRH